MAALAAPQGQSETSFRLPCRIAEELLSRIIPNARELRTDHPVGLI